MKTVEEKGVSSCRVNTLQLSIACVSATTLPADIPKRAWKSTWHRLVYVWMFWLELGMEKVSEHVLACWVIEVGLGTPTSQCWKFLCYQAFCFKFLKKYYCGWDYPRNFFLYVDSERVITLFPGSQTSHWHICLIRHKHRRCITCRLHV